MIPREVPRYALVGSLLAAACVTRLPLGDDRGSSDGQPTAGAATAGAATAGASPLPCRPCDDFPSDPIIVASTDPTVPGASTDAPDHFDPSLGTGTSGPCLVEPEDDVLFPQNWLRPRFRLIPPNAAGSYLFEIRVHAPAEANDLVVYTTASSWTMPKPMWTNLAAHAVDQGITVSVRSAEYASGQTAMPQVGSTSTFSIAPAPAPGTIVYWTTAHGSAIKAFAVGDEQVAQVLEARQTKGQCLGCHSPTPDGKYVGFSLSDDEINGEPARLELRSSDGGGSEPPFMSDAARELLARTRQDTPTFSAAHFNPADHIVLSTLNGELIWTDLEATGVEQGTGWGVLSHAGDPRRAAGLSWSHDGSRVVYVSSTAPWETATADGDLVAIPYADKQGGDAVPVLGASDPTFNEYYPAFSSDDRLLAFDRVSNGLPSDNNPASELFIVPSAGGKSVRLRANDPPACQPQASAGASNTYAKWAPYASTVGDKTYYWLAFSSTRNDNSLPQLYLTAVVLNRGALSTHGALYLWNQPADEGNHSPAWGAYELPESLR